MNNILHIDVRRTLKGTALTFTSDGPSNEQYLLWKGHETRPVDSVVYLRHHAIRTYAALRMTRPELRACYRLTDLEARDARMNARNDLPDLAEFFGLLPRHLNESEPLPALGNAIIDVRNRQGTRYPATSPLNTPTHYATPLEAALYVREYPITPEGAAARLLTQGGHLLCTHCVNTYWRLIFEAFCNRHMPFSGATRQQVVEWAPLALRIVDTPACAGCNPPLGA